MHRDSRSRLYLEPTADAPDTSARSADRHNAAATVPRAGFERAIVSLMECLMDYERAYLDRFDSPVSADYIIGPAHADIARAARVLLNGDTGRLDCGHLDSILRSMLPENEQ